MKLYLEGGLDVVKNYSQINTPTLFNLIYELIVNMYIRIKINTLVSYRSTIQFISIIYLYLKLKDCVYVNHHSFVLAIVSLSET